MNMDKILPPFEHGDLFKESDGDKYWFLETYYQDGFSLRLSLKCILDIKGGLILSQGYLDIEEESEEDLIDHVNLCFSRRVTIEEVKLSLLIK
jgi:hypothetical protein